MANATTGTDNITQSSGPDTLIVTSTTEIQPLDFFDGAGGTDTIVIGAPGAGVSVILAGVTTDATHGFHNYEALSFVNTSGTSQAILAAAQFGSGLISTSLAVQGTNGSVQQVLIGLATTFSAATWTFTNWEATDFVAILGGAGADTLTGSIMNDQIAGDANSDILSGLGGNDSLDGGAGTDTLRGGLGKDTMKGSGDADIFDFNLKTETPRGANRDVIVDFSGVGGDLDRIDVSGIDAKTGPGNAGNQVFKFIGAQKFHHKAGELHIVKHGGTFVTVEGDINGDGKADFQIDVHNLTNDLNSLLKADFIL